MNRSQILGIITGHAKEVIPDLENYEFQPNDALKDLGANSIDRSEIVMLTLETLALRIPLVELTDVNNIGELADTIYVKQSQIA